MNKTTFFISAFIALSTTPAQAIFGLGGGYSKRGEHCEGICDIVEYSCDQTQLGYISDSDKIERRRGKKKQKLDRTITKDFPPAEMRNWCQKNCAHKQKSWGPNFLANLCAPSGMSSASSSPSAASASSSSSSSSRPKTPFDAPILSDKKSFSFESYHFDKTFTFSHLVEIFHHFIDNIEAHSRSGTPKPGEHYIPAFDDTATLPHSDLVTLKAIASLHQVVVLKKDPARIDIDQVITQGLRGEGLKKAEAADFLATGRVNPHKLAHYAFILCAQILEKGGFSPEMIGTLQQKFTTISNAIVDKGNAERDRLENAPSGAASHSGASS